MNRARLGAARSFRVPAAALCWLALAAHESAAQPVTKPSTAAPSAPRGSTVPGQAAAVAPARAQPSVSRKITDDFRAKAFQKLPHVGFVRFAPGQPPEPFHTDRATLRVPRGENLQELLKLAGLELLETTPTGKPPMLRASAAARAPLRQQAARTDSYVYVKLPQRLVSLVSAERAARAQFGKAVEFDSERAIRAMGAILEFNATFRRALSARARAKASQPAPLPQGPAGPALLPDYLLSPAQLLMADSAREGGDLVTQPAADAYWKQMDLWRAWQLSQVAAPALLSDSWVAVVDQGFVERPGLAWDEVRSRDGAIGRPSDFGAVPWHGSNCSSVLNAAVNDELGAAGAALLGSGSNVGRLHARGVKLMAVEMPQATHGSFTAIANGILDALEDTPRAQIVSVSYAGQCGPVCRHPLNGTRGDQPIVDALAVARERAALVVFAAGNDFANLDPEDVYYVGCEVPGALCVGGVSREATRWSNYAVQGTNFGKAIHAWGPATSVWVNGDGQFPSAHGVSGTSMAAPFVAGALALVQSAWGQAKDLEFWKQTLAVPVGAAGSVVGEASDDAVKPGILDVYKLMRKHAVVAKDATESGNPPNGSACTRAAEEPAPSQLFTLHHPADRDCFPIDTPSSGCETVHVRVDYLRDDTLGALKVRLEGTDASPAPLFTDAATGALGFSANVCAPGSPGAPPNGYTLQVYQEPLPKSGGGTTPGLTTGYSLRIDRGAPTQTGGGGGGEVTGDTSGYETFPEAPATDRCQKRKKRCAPRASSPCGVRR